MTASLKYAAGDIAVLATLHGNGKANIWLEMEDSSRHKEKWPELLLAIRSAIKGKM